MRIRITIFLLLLAALLPASAQSASSKVCVVVSREIRPFLLMTDALEAGLDAAVTRVYLDSAYRAYGESGKLFSIVEHEFDLFVAVGPRALSFLVDAGITTRLIYSMVLNPESFVSKIDPPVPGVSLSIFSLTQLTLIKQVFPDIRRVGVLYDPAHNSKWFSSARLLANSQQIELVPLQVSDRSRIQTVLDDQANEVDAVLFIPDATVISTTIIRHAIKQLILKKIPAIGYNSFFTEAGAAMSFVVDYEKMGTQVANLAHSFLGIEQEKRVGHLFNIRLNSRVIQLLNLRLGSDLPENVEFEE